jgi:general nucleoside transport system ATP-binding protein
MPPDPTPAPLISLRAVTKAYPGILANDRIDLDVAAGEIHALLGENGAGKSTLVRIMAGVTQPDSGEIRWQGAPVSIADPAAARRLGIGMVFQHFTLFETLTVAENIVLGGGAKGLDGSGVSGASRRALAARIRDVAARYGLAVDPERHVHGLSVGERQRVEILRCLLQEPRLVILDEPTSVLTPQEAAALFETLRRLAGEGRGILFISHKLEEVRALCQRATVLRQGRVVAAADPRTTPASELARLMVGADVPAPARAEPVPTGGVRLAVSVPHLPPTTPHGRALSGIDIALRGGELLGIAGVAGNGQSELLELLAGERLAPSPESVRLDGRPVGRLGPAERRRLGLATVPEERLGRGAVGEMSLAENALLTAAGAGLVKGGLVDAAATGAFAENVIARYAVAARGPAAEAQSLSGGNMQKYIIGRELLREPKVVVGAHPTWGVDVGAAAAIHRALVSLKARGAAILLISEDLDELLALADRVAVISRGRLSAPVAAAAADRGRLGELMAGLGAAPGREAAHAA